MGKLFFFVLCACAIATCENSEMIAPQEVADQ